MTVRIAQISDTHLSPGKPYFGDNFETVAAALRDSRPDLVINTGDLALDGADHEDDLTTAKAAHEALGLDWHALPGNHDVGDHPEVAMRQSANAERLARYRRVMGPDCWVLDVPGWRMLGLNGLTLGTDLDGAAEQDALIRETVAGLAGRSLAVFTHKPLMDEAYGEALVSNRICTPSGRAALLSALGGAVPTVVACGHVHQYRDTVHAGTRHIWAPATSFMISDPWQPVFGAKTVGYVEHEFDADGGWRHRLVPVRGLAHHDLAAFPGAYGDVRRWGEGGA